LLRLTCMSWQMYAAISALAAGATAVFAKAGLSDVPPHLGNAVRTAMVLVLATAIVLATGEYRHFHEMSRRGWLFLALSGLATAISWVAYFKALSIGDATPVTAIDKASLAITLLLSALFLREAFGWRTGVGVGLIVGGALLVSTDR
jgi:bacterial/archaeal transporter family protein